ncbi:Hypothetical predicted protein [Paramuricea clavata]|uniref:Uncharacterized protein n=1 Tax=Paramuricea clavata TaxID=317549 RepID=A0A7D9HBS4_PARCT|nr:Hypothetical predicted protein [Paramuricea clavata]
MKQKQQFSNPEKFLQAAEINSSILEKGKEKWKLEKEMKMLSKAESKLKSSAKKKCKQQKRNEKQSSVNVSPSGIDMYVTSSPPSTDVQRSMENKILTVGRKLNADMFVTCIKDMTLDEYSVAIKRHCNDCHKVRSCSKCKPVLEAINEIGEKGIVPLSTVYRKCFGSVYKFDKAVRRIIQLPVIFCCFDQLFATEYVDGLDFTKLASCVAKYVPQNCLSSGTDKGNLKLLCELASSEKDRHLIRVASCQGKSGHKAKRLGVSNLNKEKIIYDAMQEYLEIKQAVNKIAQAKIVNMEPGNDSDTMTCDSSEGQSCVWITDDEREEQNMSDGQRKQT